MKVVSTASLLLLFSVGLMGNCLAQSNVGIGTSIPARAKVELHGNIGGTTALFGGDGSGVSLMADPALGFNAYSSNTGLKYMANGFAAMQVWINLAAFCISESVHPAQLILLFPVFVSSHYSSAGNDGDKLFCR